MSPTTKSQEDPPIAMDGGSEAYRSAAGALVSQLRKDGSRRSLSAFCQTYLPAHFRLPPSPMHERIGTLIEEGVGNRGLRVAIAAPRGHAKSTLVSLGYVLWCVCYQTEPFIVLISDTADQAIDMLSIVKHELESNPRLIEDFPDAVELPLEPPGPERWRKDDIIARNGVRVMAMGAEQKIRGRRNRSERPSLIVLDDVENEEMARSPEQRDKRKDWLRRAVLKAGTGNTNVIVVGTVIHHDSLLAELLNPRRSPAWITERYKAVLSWSERGDLWDTWQTIFTHQEEHEGRTGPSAARCFYEEHQGDMLAGTEVLWPELEDYYSLMVQRLSDGPHAFASEKQNEPTESDEAIFREEEMVFWDDQYPSAEVLLATLGTHPQIYGACDPSLGKAGRRHDDTAIITIARDFRSKVMYVLDADIRRRKPDEIIEAIITMHRARSYRHFGMEEVQFQAFLKTELERRCINASCRMNVEGVKSTTDKVGRIQRLQPLLTSGMLRLCRRHVTLLEQLRQFPYAAHDDGPDALEMAVRVAEKSRFRVVQMRR